MKALLDELACYLRPPGQGIHTVSTGKREQLAQTRAYLGESWDPEQPWREQLSRVVGAKFAMLAIPSDTGAGIMRGAARGPEAIRAALGRAPVLDLGDVLSIPQLLDEEMLSDSARARCQDALWPELPEDRRRTLPVSPLGMAERVRRLLLELAPQLRLLLLGGDHTVTWPVLAPLLDGPTEDLGLVHFDAHTDLLPERLGIRYCFATWAWHANARLGGQRLVQVGIRASARSREHWEQTLGVKQIWADEARALEPHALARVVVDHLEARGVSRVYISNDIDGTDARFAAACGTPEPDGLSPDHVLAVTEAVGECFHVIGADLVELAPGLSLDANLAETSVQTAFSYVQALLRAMRANPLEG
jgi:arginase family enzyme